MKTLFCGKRILPLILSSLLIGWMPGCTSDRDAETASTPSAKEAPAPGHGTIIDKFISPDVDARIMARMWFPDAGAGADEKGLAQVERQIREMADGGFGGVEISYISDATDYDNEAAGKYGWASENWKKLLKQVLKTANGVEKGFKVDITITAHWPPVANNLDPNDDAASQEASFAFEKITKSDIAAGRMDLPLPAAKKKDYASFYEKGGDATADFLFVDKFSGAVIARVSGFDGQGNPVFELASLKDVSGETKKKTAAGGEAGKNENGVLYAGWPAGVPDAAYCEANGLDYAKVLSQFGPQPVEEDFSGKIDGAGNRKRMADWQYLYETDLSALDGLTASSEDTLQAGDYVLFGCYYRGTGQVLSGGSSVVMVNRCYATDYFSDIGIQKVFDVWSDHILDDEMLALLKENGRKNGTSIFEDSIEIHKSGPAWTHDLLKEYETYAGYNAANYLPLLAMGSTGRFDDAQQAARIIEDYNSVLSSLYANEHALLIRKWAADFNYTYRAQGHGLTGVDMCDAALALDIPEGDNGTSGDGVRQLAAAVNMKGGKMVSNESVTFSANINSKWSKTVQELHADYSYGVNRAILHGSAFTRAFNGYYSAWPGWNFGKHVYMEGLNGSGFSAWNGRQIWWEDAATASNYMSRLQAVMQNGQARVDLAALIGANGGFGGRGNSLQGLLDRGYSYNTMTEAVIKHNNAAVTGGILAADGPAYRALVIGYATKLSVAGLTKIIGFAKAGLPVILYNTEITQVQGTNRAVENDDAAKAAYAELVQTANVYRATTQEEILDVLKKKGITSAAAYDQSGLETSHRKALEGDYYYLFNNRGIEGLGAPGGGMPGGSPQGGMPDSTGEMGGMPAGGRGGAGDMPAGGAPQGGMPQGGGMPSGLPQGGSGMPAGGRGGAGDMPAGGPPQEGMPDGAGAPGRDSGPSGMPQQQAPAAEAEDIDYTIRTTVTLTGEGTPYILDAWTGEIIPVAKYTTGGDAVTFDIELGHKDAMVVCVTRGGPEFPDAGASRVVSSTGGRVVYADGEIVHRAEAPGTYDVTFNTGESKTVRVDHVPEPLSITSGWNLGLESWGPVPGSENLSIENNIGYELDPTRSVKKAISFTGIGLGTWSDLPVSGDQLATLGVEGMGMVSGIGTYTTTVSLPQDWTPNVGAVMAFEHHSDMIAVVIVNGHRIDPVNQMTDRVDVGAYLKPGENSIEIKLDSTLQNRDPAAKEKTVYGLEAVSLIPYAQTPL